jgi:hypothetical protein
MARRTVLLKPRDPSFPEIKLDGCPQCNAEVKELTKEGVKFTCGSELFVDGEKVGTLRSTGICAINGIGNFDKWRDKMMSQWKRHR